MVKRFLALAALATILAAGSVSRADAQEFGPHRTLLMIGAYGTGLMLDVGEDQDRADLFGVGGRLMLNLAPFSGPGNNLLDNLVIGGFVSYARDEDISVLHYGGELDVHFVHNPLGGFLDPFLLVGAGALRTSVESSTIGARSGRSTDFALSPGAGIRIPLTGLLEIRVDGRDAIVFSGETTHSPEFTAGLNLRF